MLINDLCLRLREKLYLMRYKFLRFLLFFCIVSIFMNCHEDKFLKLISSAESAKDVLLTEIKNKKVIFISENHNDVNPIIFLSENLEDFYNAGVRYLVLESGLKSKPGDTDYKFLGFYPWTVAGWKYDWVLLSYQIERLNEGKSNDDYLHVISGEETLDISNLRELSDEKILNLRDETLFNVVTQLLHKLKPTEKVLVFYGGAHGSKIIRRNYKTAKSANFDWEPFGYLISKAIKDQFISVDYIYQSQFTSEYYANDSPLIVKSSSLNFLKSYSKANRYDYTIIDSEPIYGVFYQYVINDENINFMISKLKKLDNLIVSEKCLENAQRFDDIGQYLLIIYYLKLYYAEHFDYSLWNPKRNLSDALYELEAYKENSNKDYSQLVSCLKLSYDDLRRFHNIMVKSGIPMSLNDKRNLDKIIKNMKEAIIIFPDDMWPLYWLAYAETLSGDYNAAILHWELLLKNPLSMSLETLPIAYEMLGKCYAETGELNRSKEIIGSISSLRTEKNIDFNCFPDL